MDLSRRSFLGGTAVAVGVTATLGTTALAEAQPPRPHQTSTPHLLEAEQLVGYLSLPTCPLANNTYKEPDQPNVVRWGSPGDASGWVNQSQCASFLTAVLKRTYRWATSGFFSAHFGLASPFARDYRAAFAEREIPHFERVTRVADLRPGDLIAVDYRNDQDTNTGHVVMVRSVKGVYTAPSSSLNFPGETQYAVEVVDCTSAPHGVYGVGNYFRFPDNRIFNATAETNGAGYGHMMFYASDTTGEFARYRWSVNTSSAGTFTMAQRPVSAARIA
ncbi:twin-arginine translocation signal domain-containing protein [Saccharothrix deserti]|uniref:twin-arginine translocation signal domain-containing protein n=1 Tax=Saccharothrix deserti TaxID=2593674 RepID=UPI00131ECBBE|nr:twin-arginine translocation signal domain-containing protein [Saccharothrix deserti]